MKRASLPSIDLPARPSSIYSNETTPPTPPAQGTDRPVPKFDLEKSFPAILRPLALLRAISTTHDLDVLRALVPVFCHCVDEIVYSLPSHPSNGYRISLSAVTSAKHLLLAHVAKMDTNQSKRVTTQITMTYVDMVMSSLKGLLHAAAYEAAQLKPLPEVPQDGVMASLRQLSLPRPKKKSIVSPQPDRQRDAKMPYAIQDQQGRLRLQLAGTYIARVPRRL